MRDCLFLKNLALSNDETYEVSNIFSYRSSDRLQRRNAKSIQSIRPRTFGASVVSCPAISCPANWSVNFTSVIFTSSIFSAPNKTCGLLSLFDDAEMWDDIMRPTAASWAERHYAPSCYRQCFVVQLTHVCNNCHWLKFRHDSADSRTSLWTHICMFTYAVILMFA